MPIPFSQYAIIYFPMFNIAIFKIRLQNLMQTIKGEKRLFVHAAGYFLTFSMTCNLVLNIPKV